MLYILWQTKSVGGRMSKLRAIGYAPAYLIPYESYIGEKFIYTTVFDSQGGIKFFYPDGEEVKNYFPAFRWVEYITVNDQDGNEVDQCLLNSLKRVFEKEVWLWRHEKKLFCQGGVPITVSLETPKTVHKVFYDAYFNGIIEDLNQSVYRPFVFEKVLLVVESKDYLGFTSFKEYNEMRMMGEDILYPHEIDPW
jgi:hypothetical protein